MQQFTIRTLLLLICAGLVNTAGAETSENFNSRKGVPVDRLRAALQGSCWTFHHFDVNDNGWNPGIEGDGAMVATADAQGFANSGIYTPVLAVPESLTLSFAYRFDQSFSADTHRWLKISLATAGNDIVQVLETIEFDGSSATGRKQYSTTFKNLFAGEYRLVLQYGGSGAGARIAIDELSISAPFRYPGGCNVAPVGVRDRITGMANRTASGSLLKNDRDAEHQTLTAYLIKGSPDGKVELTENGSFVFTPRKGFTGNSTSFTYKVCDNGAVNLCSENTTVLITFPELPKPALSLTDFNGSYVFNGNVELAWKVAPGTSGSFGIERSYDGITWDEAGVVQGNAESVEYNFVDRMGRNRVLKNDLYYRLKQVREDESEVLSRLLVVRVYNTRTLTMISVTPNPAKNDIAVNVQLQETAVVSLRLLNNNGNSVMHKIVEEPRGLNNILLEGTSKIAPGVYSLEVIVNSREHMVIKLIKE